MPKGKKPKHIFINIPPETFYRILSNLNLRELATVSQVSKWMHFIIAHLKIDYQLLTIKKSPESLMGKEIIATPQTSAYCHLRFKLSAEAPRKKEMLEIIKIVKRENESKDSVEVSKEAMKAIAGIFALAGSPAVGGALLDKLINVKQYMLGLSAYDVGYTLTIAMLSAFCAWIFKVMRDEMGASYEGIQLIDEENAFFKLPAY